MNWFWRLLRGDDETAALCKLIIALLKDCPQGWKVGSYYAEYRESDLRVWIANRVYGLHVEASGYKIEPRWWWRRSIYRAFQPLKARLVLEARRSQFQKIRDNVVEMRSRSA